jgi:ABC-type multidrug transport system fused ATPase/permease subunit
VREIFRRFTPSVKLAALEYFSTYLPRVLSYARPHRRWVVLTVATMIPMSLVGLLAPWPLKFLVDSVVGNEPLPGWLSMLLGPQTRSRIGLIVFVALAHFGIALLAGGIEVLYSYVTVRLNVDMTLDFRSAMFQHANRLSLAYHDRRQSGMMLYKINYMDSAPTELLMALLPLVMNVLTLVGMVWICLAINPKLALLSLVVVPILYYSVGYYSRHVRNRIYHVRNLEGETITIIHESLAMMRVIAAFGREDYEHGRLIYQGERANNARVQLTVRQTLFSLAVGMTMASGTALVLGFGAYETLQGRLTVGQLLVVLAYIASVYSPLKSLSTSITDLQGQLINLKLAFDHLDEVPEVQDRPGAVRIDDTNGHLIFDDVGFSYEGRVNTLRGISLQIKPGQTAAIVGRTGAGKSTLANLVTRFYDPTAGSILLDGIDIRDITIASLRAQISVVLQEPLLFSTSIEENIRYGRLDATMEEIVAAAKAANVHDFVMAMPDQYQTSVGERGAQLSGGERQRVGIARAFLKNAPILILDEPTSSVDPQTEEVILDAIGRLMAGRTTLIIAHRLSTIRGVDVVVVMHEGRVVEKGTHEELLARDGYYKELHDIQSSERRRPETVL